MKKSIVILALFLGLIVDKVVAQSFEETLKSTFLQFDTTRAIDTKITASNRLELIANKYADKWTAPYYAAYSKTMLAIMEQDPAKKDQYLDAADQYLTKAMTLAPENDEVHVVAAMIASNRIGVDPQNRWKKYGKIFDTHIETAKKLRKDNPRIYLLQGLGLLYTPETYGGGKKRALPYFEKAQALYDQEKEGVIEKPFWGKPINALYLAQCQQANSAGK
jgi:hypothetical protein